MRVPTHRGLWVIVSLATAACGTAPAPTDASATDVRDVDDVASLDAASSGDSSSTTDTGAVTDTPIASDTAPTDGGPNPADATATDASATDAGLTPVTGIWLSRDEILRLPMTGTAWSRVAAAAAALSGSADLGNNDSLHDTSTLAAALVAVRTGDDAMRTRTIAAIETVYASGYARVLELSRNVQSYVIAADIIGPTGWDATRFRDFVHALATRPLTGHSGGNNLLETARFSANNWGCHARAALAVIGLYTGDAAFVTTATEAQLAFLSGRGGEMNYTDTTWHAGTPRSGINVRGAMIEGHDVSGVIPEDQRRTGEYTWPAPQGSYPWEALQGTIVAGVVLERAGRLPFVAGDNAIVRAALWLTNVNSNPAAGDDSWQPWLLNRYGSAGLATSTTSPGKNMGWTDWTHGG